jgi:sugar phosphate isomerase/epimerase
MTVALGARAVGGPMGTMSAHDAADAVRRRHRYDELLGALATLGETGRAAGLDHLLIEPTPVHREIPNSIRQTERLAADLEARGVPFGWCLDTGHTVCERLYGPDAKVTDWLDALAGQIRLVHLGDTDGNATAGGAGHGLTAPPMPLPCAGTCVRPG